MMVFLRKLFRAAVSVLSQGKPQLTTCMNKNLRLASRSKRSQTEGISPYAFLACVLAWPAGEVCSGAQHDSSTTRRAFANS